MKKYLFKTIKFYIFFLCAFQATAADFFEVEDENYCFIKAKVRESQDKLDLAIALEKKRISEKFLIYKSLYLGQNIDLGPTDEFRSPKFDELLALLEKTDLIKVLPTAIPPVLNSVFICSENISIKAFMKSTLDKDRSNLSKLKSARSLNQKFLDTGDLEAFSEALQTLKSVEKNAHLTKSQPTPQMQMKLKPKDQSSEEVSKAIFELRTNFQELKMSVDG